MWTAIISLTAGIAGAIWILVEVGTSSVMPWPQLIALVVAFIVIMILGTIFSYRYLSKKENF